MPTSIQIALVRTSFVTFCTFATCWTVHVCSLLSYYFRLAKIRPLGRASAGISSYFDSYLSLARPFPAELPLASSTSLRPPVFLGLWERRAVAHNRTAWTLQ